MAFSGVKRASQTRLYDLNRRRPLRKALEEFLIHGVKYSFPPDIRSMTRGIPTAFASPTLRDYFAYDSENIYVRHHPKVRVQGVCLPVSLWCLRVWSFANIVTRESTPPEHVHPKGHERGIGFSPLYKSIPEVAMKDEKLYAALGLVDALRLGRAREIKLAEKLLIDMLKYNE